MPKYLNIKNWNRKDHFNFFKDYDNPFFNICLQLDVTKLFKFVKDQKLSFFTSLLYLSIKTANEVQQFRWRIRDENVIIHDVVHAGSTVLNNDNETFSFCYFKYNPNFKHFAAHVSRELKDNQASGGKLDPQDFRDDMIHYSVLPWIAFNSISHPRKFNQIDSVPKIVFGKYHRTENEIKMPISIEVHHGLMDGIHVARYLDLFQNYLNDSEKILTFK
ncbi:hypothetical protein B6I21_05415 [candidate division KSB1 bacterium 4572_119]|nr:MAG: hypothetical protein B6I21_05415 [candidate division KSB1 bacterium 4572_119]